MWLRKAQNRPSELELTEENNRTVQYGGISNLAFCQDEDIGSESPTGGVPLTNLTTSENASEKGATAKILITSDATDNLKGDMPSQYTKLVEDNSYCATIEKGTEDELVVFGYCESSIKKVLYFVLAVLTLGFSLLVVRWHPVWGVLLTCIPCHLAVADTIIIKDSFGKNVVKVKHEKQPSFSVGFSNISNNGNVQNNSLYQEYHSDSSVNLEYYHYFVYKCIRYVWNENCKGFNRLRGYEGVPVEKFHEEFHGLSDAEHKDRYQLYGPNIIHIEVKSYFRLFFDEVLNPFYIFQIFSITLWCVDNYIYYASCIAFISLISIAVSLHETKKQTETLRDMVAQSNAQTVTVCRQNAVLEDVSATDLVPGDMIVIPSHGCLMSCDAVLINGNCIVNESMLTGESVPETKTPLPSDESDENFSFKKHKRHILFCGTKIIQTRYYGNNKVFAIVVRTGFSTAKGELVRSILFPRPVGFKFYRDAIKFVLVLFGIAFLGMAYSLYTYIKRSETIKDTIIRTLDIVTIVVPPALPAAMTIGTIYAQNRLKKQGIYCISPPRINVGGKLELICFDKTGTLTEEGMDLSGVVPADKGSFQKFQMAPDEIDDHDPLKAAMACCHSLTIIDGELTGDPMELKMFSATKWLLEEPGNEDTSKYDLLAPTVVRPSKPQHLLSSYAAYNTEFSALPSFSIGNEEPPDYSVGEGSLPSSAQSTKQVPVEIGILRQFPFSSELQRMSVICRTLGMNHMDMYIKGAPEKIVSLCHSDTVPHDFTSLLQNYTVQGYRVIAVAWRALGPSLHWHIVQKIKRDEVEHDFTFLGLLVMQNTLKPETTPALQVLHKADIRTIMITGDNILTSMSVARKCNMIPSSDKIVLVKAYPPEGGNPAKIEIENNDLSPPDNDNIQENFVKHNDIMLSQVVNMETQKKYHFATDGKSFGVIRINFPTFLKKLLVKGTVFARMAPEQKTQAVEALQELGYTVGMCGDGANDCGALKTADVGISISEAEASVAAPFTSNIPNIACVSIVIREGRCALMTSFSMFKFIALYSLIQFTSTLILYTVESVLTDSMFLYIDLGVVTTLATVMSYTGAYEKLVAQRPRGSLISTYSISSVILQTLFVVGFQIGTIIFVRLQTWYLEPVSEIEATPSWKNTSVFLMSCYQYITMAVVFAKGPPHRKPFYSNFWFTGVLIILTLFTTLLVFNPVPSLADVFTIVWHHYDEQFNYRLTLLLLAGCNFVLSLAVELFVVESKLLNQVFKSKKQQQKMYEKIKKEMECSDMLSLL